MEKEDNFTSTVDGVAGFERMRVGRHREIPEDYTGDDSPIEDFDDEPEELIKERKCTVGCSDPKCDCGGYRRDGLPI